MPANMTRLSQVGGMSTRQSMNRPRRGNLHWQGTNVLHDRLNKAQLNGFDGPATTVHTRGKVFDGKAFVDADWPRQEKVWGKDTDIKFLLRACLNADLNWKPSRYARKAWREHPYLAARGSLGF